MKKILHDKDYYNALDYTSGEFLTIFYMHSKYLHHQSTRAKGNNLTRMEFSMHNVDSVPNVSPKFIAENIFVSETLPSPSIIFFNISGDNITEYTVAQLKNNEIEKGFNELLDIVKIAVNSLSSVKAENRSNEQEIFALVKRSIESSEFWKDAGAFYKKMMKVKDFIFFWKV